MVSTRQMSIINGNVNEYAAQTVEYSPSRQIRAGANTAYAPPPLPEADRPVHELEGQPSTSADTSTSYRVTRQNSQAAPEKPSSAVGLLDLPQEVIGMCLSYLPFKNVCQLRLVCKTFDSICAQVLNSTFQKLQAQMLHRFQAIKSKMPRRESARRNHHLACESDIIETLHMRLTLLQMSFGKHIERNYCCFFPGEILDEVYNILHYIKVTPKLSRPYKVTDELFDLSTMAMEYFKEKIEPELPEIAYFGTDFLDFTGTFSSSGTNKYLALDSSPLGPEEVKETDRPNCDILDNEEPLPQSNMVLRKRIRKIKQGMKRYNSQLSLLKQDLRSCKRKTAEQQKQISDQQKQLAEQQKQTVEYAGRLDEYDKKNDEISRKFSTLLQELNKCKTELQYWRSKSPATPPFCTGCGTVMVPPTDDLEALVNQGVIPEELEQVSNFIPIPSTSAEAFEEPEEERGGSGECPQKVDEPLVEAPVVVKVSKRKVDELKDTPTCANSGIKTRRVQKNRSKRIKL